MDNNARIIYIGDATVEQMVAAGIPQSGIDAILEQRAVVRQSIDDMGKVDWRTHQERSVDHSMELIRAAILDGYTSITEIVGRTRLSRPTVIRYRRIIKEGK